MVATLDPITALVARIKPEHFEGDLIKPGHPLFGYVWVNKDRMSGTPCFTGSRVPITHLLEHLESGTNIEEFLDGFPGVLPEQCTGVLRLAVGGVLAEFIHP